MRRKLLAMLLTLCMALTTVPAALAADFPDVAQDAWYKENVDYVVEKGMMKGISTFSAGLISPEIPEFRQLSPVF